MQKNPAEDEEVELAAAAVSMDTTTSSVPAVEEGMRSDSPDFHGFPEAADTGNYEQAKKALSAAIEDIKKGAVES